MKNKIKWVAALSGVCALTFYAGAYMSVQASASDRAELWDGFEISATAVRTADPVGLRFKTDVEHLTPTMKKYNPDAEYYTTLTLTTGGKTYSKDIPVSVWREDGSGWNTVLLSIPESDYATEITAQSFIKLNGKETEFFQTEPVTVSITQTAAAAISYGANDEYITQYVDEQVSSLTLDKTSVMLEEGQTLNLTATTTPVQCMAKWTSSDTTVATVDNFGNVKAKGVGESIIAAEINGYTATCNIMVTERQEKVILVSGNITGGGSTSVSNGVCTVSLRWLTGETIKISPDFLNGIFRDGRVEAVTFDVKGSRAIELTSNYLSALSLSTTYQPFVLTRTAYEKWQANGGDFKIQSDLTITNNSATIYFANFKKVWAMEESEILTKVELQQLNGLMPDYKYNSHQFEFFGYSSLTDGSWQEYDEETGKIITYQAEEDYRNAYRIEEYKDAGMTILFPQSACAIEAKEGTSFEFSTSVLKQVMDMAVRAGMQKVVVSDYRLYALIETGSIVGEGKAFATEMELDAQIREYMQPYAMHEGFYGVQLLDEPAYTKFTALGEVYKAIKRCYPNVYIQTNLYPPVGGESIGKVFPEPTATSIAKYTAGGIDEVHAIRFAAYEEYLNAFLDATGADYIMYDQYPLRDSGLYECYVGGMQVAANVCATRGVEFRFVMQTCTYAQGTTGVESENNRILAEEDLRFLNNMLLGFGCKQVAYFTYMTHENVFKGGLPYETYEDSGSFITREGEKTDIYYLMRKILTENQAFAGTILNYDYTTSATYIASGAVYSTTNAVSCMQGDFAKLESVQINTESTLVAELCDKLNNRYMYMAQNLVDPLGGAVQATQTVKLTFNENYEYAIVWKNGEKNVVRLENNHYVGKLNAGGAVYVIPFNPDESNKNDGFLYDQASGDNGAWFPGLSAKK